MQSISSPEAFVQRGCRHFAKAQTRLGAALVTGTRFRVPPVAPSVVPEAEDRPRL